MTTEAELQTHAIHLARYCGWLCHHTRPAITKKGWRTPIQGDKGFPDVVFAHEQHRLIIFAEFKSDKGRTTPEQRHWATAIEAAAVDNPFVHYRLWRPSDWPAIEQTLKEGTLA